MAQNTSYAVMQQRREAKDSLEDFPTPPWATRALCEWIAPCRKRLERQEDYQEQANG